MGRALFYIVFGGCVVVNISSSVYAAVLLSITRNLDCTLLQNV